MGEKALLVSVSLPGSEVDPQDSLAELASLVNAGGAQVAGQIIQRRRKPDTAYYVGKGKAVQIAERAQQWKVSTVVFDNDLSPGQIRELEKVIPCKVLDRSEVILDIFASRARTHEAKLQVDLAQLQYTYPRLSRMWSHLDTVVGAAAVGAAGAIGGIGTRGTGEKQLEIDRRLVQRRITALRRQIKQIDQRKQREVRSRSRENFTVSLVGYTSSGKSTLMNLLTGSEAYAADKLFATLDTKTTRWKLANNLSVLLSDTVGFVRDLPHHLVASFRATLEETIHADLLLHVVDVSTESSLDQFKAVNSVLAEMGCDEKAAMVLLNKVDKAGAGVNVETMETLYPEALAISARTGYGTAELIERVTERVAGEIVRLRVKCEYADGRVHSFLRAHGTVISEKYSNSHIMLESLLGRRLLGGLRKLAGESIELLGEDGDDGR